MALIVRAERADVEHVKVMDTLLDHLRTAQYSPLISQAKNDFLKTFGETIHEGSEDPDTLRSTVERESIAAYARAISARSSHYEALLAGDIMFSPKSRGLLYAHIIVGDMRRFVARSDVPNVGGLRLEIGYVGDDTEVDCLSKFSKLVKESLSTSKKTIELVPYERTSDQFVQLTKGETTKFVTAGSVSNTDVKLASILEDKEKREIALTVRRAGGMLATDLSRKFTKPDVMKNTTEELIQEKLLSREYVVQCRQTSNQINRVKSLDIIEKMSEHGVQCSCGTPIADEQIQELFSPSRDLQRILKQSYWMTAKLVHMLRELGVSDDRILLNLQEGPEEIDTFVDLEGTLLMFELKDSEFSMGHAYPFSGRIGLYRPNYAIIVATAGIAPEVKTYIERIKPASTVRYVEHLNELKRELDRIRDQVYAIRARQTLSLFNRVAAIDVPVSRILESKIGLPPEKEPRTRYDDVFFYDV